MKLNVDEMYDAIDAEDDFVGSNEDKRMDGL